MAAQKYNWLNKFTRPTRPIHRAKLAAEHLEDRAVPAVFLVTSNDDVNSGSAVTLREAIVLANANAGPDTIRIEPGASGTYTLASDMVQITDDVSIVLNNKTTSFTVNGSGTFQLLSAAAADVSVNRVFFTDGFVDGNGGAISVTDGNLILKNSYISSSEATGNGGGVSVVNGNLTVFNTDLVANSAAGDGGGAYVDSEWGVVNITAAIFGGDGAATTGTSAAAGNTAGSDGGGLYAAGAAVTIKGSRFDSNVAEVYGGGVYVINGPLTVTEDTKNTPGELDDVASVITRNEAGGGGGGISTEDSDVLVNKGTVVSENTAGTDGGGISVYLGSLTVRSSFVNGNGAGDQGGGIWIQGGDLLITNRSEVNGNSAANSGGGIYAGTSASTGTTATTGTTDFAPFSHTAGVTNVTVISSSVNGNQAFAGGGIFASGADVLLKAGEGGLTTVNSNAATATTGTTGTVTGALTGGVGGGVAAVASVGTTSLGDTFVVGGNIRLEGAVVNGNTAYGSGGGLYSSGGDVNVAVGLVVIDGWLNWFTSSVNENTSIEGDGGGIAAEAAEIRDVADTLVGLVGGDVNVTSGDLYSNWSEGDGGGIYAFGGNVEIKGANSDIQWNRAGDNGGGVAAVAFVGDIAGDETGSRPFGGNVLVGSTVSSGGRIFDNTAAFGNGGGIYSFGGDIVVEGGAIVSSNEAMGTEGGGDGGGLYAEAATFTTSFTTGTGTTATTITNTFSFPTGGNVTVQGGARVTWNTAYDDGGGVWASAGVTIIDAEVSDNFAYDNGGGVYSFGDVDVTDAAVDDNQAGFDDDGDGGGIWTGEGATVTVDTSSVSGNYAGDEGGGIYAEFVDISYSTLDGNRSENDGGAIYADNVEIFSSTISNNAANVDDGTTGSGGGVYVGGFIEIGGEATIVNSTISGNSGVEGGGIFVEANYTLVLESSTVVLNDAEEGGGGLTGEDDDSIVLNNTIVAGNTAFFGSFDDDIGTGVDTGASNFNLIGDAGSSGGLANGSNGNIVGDDGVGVLPVGEIIVTTLADNGGPTLTHALAVNSVAVDAGNESANTLETGEFDQRGAGFPRVVSDALDIGAVEDSDRSTVASAISANGIVRAFNKFGDELHVLVPFGVGADVRVAIGDVNGDENPDIVVGNGKGNQVQVFDGATGFLLSTTTVYGKGYTKGVYVAAGGDVDGDGRGDVVVGPGQASTAKNQRPVLVLDGQTLTPVAGANSFIPLDKIAKNGAYPNGVRVALGNADGDANAEVYVVGAPGVTSRVEIWDHAGAKFNLVADFKAFTTSGATIATLDLNGDGRSEVAIGSSSGNSRVQVYDGVSFVPLVGLGIAPQAGTSPFTLAGTKQEVRIALQDDTDGDGLKELVVATGPNTGIAKNNVQQVRVFDIDLGANLLILNNTITAGALGLPAGYAAGIYVA